MADVTIRLIIDPKTRKKNVVISYTSDEDALPIEHEDAHRDIVEKLIEGGTLKAQELGKIVVEREGGEAVGEVTSEEQTEGEAISQEG